MAFDPSTSAYSLFPSFQRQASVNGGVVKNGSVSSQISGVSVLEPDVSSSIHRSHRAHEDPLGLISYAQNNIKIRKPTDTDCDGETGLQRLVSSILEEVDSKESFFSDRSRSCNSLWFQMTEELPKYSHLQQNPILLQNYSCPETFGKTRDQRVSKDSEEFFQQNNGNIANQQWFCNLASGDDNYSQNTQKLLLGRPNSRSNYFTQRQQGKLDYTLSYKDKVNGQPVNHFSDLSDVFGPERKMRSPSFIPSEENFSQSNAQLIGIEQYTPQELNQQFSSLHSFTAGENDTLCQVDFPNTHRQTGAMHLDETIAEQCKIVASAMPSQLGRTFGTELMERNGGANNQIINYHAFQDQPGFSSQNTNYFEQPKPIFASLNCPNQYQNKATMHQRNMEQFSKQHIQQTKVQSKIRPPMQDDQRRMLLSGFPGEGFNARLPTNTDVPIGDEKQGLLQNLYFEPLDKIQFKRSDEGHNMIHAANAQKLLPHAWPVNDSRRIPNITVNSANLSTRPTRPYGRAAAGVDIGDMRSAIESAAFNFYDRGMMTRRGENNYHGNTPAMAASVVMNQGYSVLQLNFYLDECNEQWRCLEAEREKTQTILSLTFPGKKSAPVTNTNIPQSPPHPSRVDYLIVKHTREHARVASILDQMECLGNFSLHTDIRTALIRHNIAICFIHARRKEEITNMSKQRCQSAHFTKDRDTLLMGSALKDLAATTRKLRTALWCALQRTLPKPCRRQEVEQHAARRSPSPFEGYSFYALTGTKHEVKI